VKTYTEAESVLLQLAGLEKTRYVDFTGRKFNRGRETLHAYFYDIQRMAAELKLPASMVQAQFLQGLPEDLGRRVRPLVHQDDEEDRVVSLVDRFMKEENQVSAERVYPIEADKNCIVQRLCEEVATLKTQISNRVPVCYYCQRKGHMARNCFARKSDQQATPTKNEARPVFRPARF
jgi:hypothetical protein